MKKICGIIQARMGSSRLSGKVLRNIAGKPALWHVINRLSQSNIIDEIVVATPKTSSNEPIAAYVKELGIFSYAGSEQDVLDRYYQAAKLRKADVIVRITSDCPLLDPAVVDKVVGVFLKGDFDYVSNTCVTPDTGCKSTYPDGLDTEVFSFAALETAWRDARLTSEREHVTPYIWKNPQLFKIGNVSNPVDLSHLRFTLDYEEDLMFINEIFKRLILKGSNLGLKDVLSVLEENPELIEINKAKTRNEGYFKSLKLDGVQT